jgi:hypothetical protein
VLRHGADFEQEREDLFFGEFEGCGHKVWF